MDVRHGIPRPGRRRWSKPSIVPNGGRLGKPLAHIGSPRRSAIIAWCRVDVRRGGQLDESVSLGAFDVNSKEANAHLAQVKLALACKCERLAKVAGSIPKRNTLKYQAAKFRRAAADLARQ